MFNAQSSLARFSSVALTILVSSSVAVNLPGFQADVPMISSYGFAAPPNMLYAAVDEVSAQSKGQSTDSRVGGAR
jgi:hypothetical protein